MKKDKIIGKVEQIVSKNPVIHAIYMKKREMYLRFCETLYDSTNQFTDNSINIDMLNKFKSEKSLLGLFIDGFTPMMVTDMIEIEDLDKKNCPYIIVVLDDDNTVFAIIPSQFIEY